MRQPDPQPCTLDNEPGLPPEEPVPHDEADLVRLLTPVMRDAKALRRKMALDTAVAETELRTLRERADAIRQADERRLTTMERRIQELACVLLDQQEAEGGSRSRVLLYGTVGRRRGQPSVEIVTESGLDAFRGPPKPGPVSKSLLLDAHKVGQPLPEGVVVHPAADRFYIEWED